MPWPTRWPLALVVLATALILGLWRLPNSEQNNQSPGQSVPSKAPDPTDATAASPFSSILATEREGVPAGLWHFYDQANQMLPKPEIDVRANLTPDQSAYFEGEIVNMEFTLSAPGYVAIFVHESTGGVRAIHPSDKSGQVERYAAGIHNLRDQVNFRVSPPFGKDLVHIMVFSRIQDLRLLLGLFGASDTEQYILLRPEAFERALPALTRSLIPMRPDEKSPQPKEHSTWGQAAIPFITRSK